MTQDIQFSIGDKEVAEIENQKLSTFESLLKDSDLDPEDLQLVTQAIYEGANDAMIEKNLDDDDV